MKAPIVPILVAFAVSGCASVQIQQQVHYGQEPLFNPSRPSLGVISLRPETRWRPDQKEPLVREQIALKAIEKAFSNLPNSRVSEIRPFTKWTSEVQLGYEKERKAGIDTVVFVTVEELGPLFYLSLPILWSGYSDIKFELQAIKTSTGESLLSVNHHRQVGGPFQVRGLWPLQEEMENALKEVLGLKQ